MAKPTNTRNARPVSPVSTPVRNTAIPKAPPAPAKAAPARTITHDVIAKRAFEISQSPFCGSEVDNWLRAERELKAR